MKGSEDDREADSKPITLDELIRIEISGKNTGLGRYDEILWKIRAGYVLGLYGALGFLVSKESPNPISAQTLAVVIGLSVVCWLFDAAFRHRQLRIVSARDRLIRFAAGRTQDADSYTVLPLLMIAGDRVPETVLGIEAGWLRTRLRALGEGAILYGGTIVIAFVTSKMTP